MKSEKDKGLQQLADEEIKILTELIDNAFGKELKSNINKQFEENFKHFKEKIYGRIATLEEKVSKLLPLQIKFKEEQANFSIAIIDLILKYSSYINAINQIKILIATQNSRKRMHKAFEDEIPKILKDNSIKIENKKLDTIFDKSLKSSRHWWGTSISELKRQVLLRLKCALMENLRKTIDLQNLTSSKDEQEN